jgi:hypothetical protein
MPQLETPRLVIGWHCDKVTCSRQLTINPRSPYDFAALQAILADNGWSCWVGRNQRFYCPDHGPSKGHKMWKAA